MKIPIVKSGEVLPETGPVYVIGKEGFYLRKHSALYESMVKIDDIPAFEPVTEYVNWTAPKLPYALLEEALEFFRAVYDRHEAEAIALLNFSNGIWSNVVPEQEVSGSRLDYKMPKLDGLAGTIHSHGNMDAFFSATDHNDVADFDGIHIVLGKINRNVPRIKAGVYVNGRLFEFEPEALIESIPVECTEDMEHPWLKQVRPCKRNKLTEQAMWSWDFDGSPFQ